MSGPGPTPEAVYFDTNIFLEARWPDASPALLEVLYLANSLSIEVRLPAPVLNELAEHWYREVLEAWIEAKSKIGNLRKKVGNAVKFREIELLPPREKLIAMVLEKAQSLTQRFVLAPITARGLQDFFADAIQKTSIIGDEGKNFQDAVILHSVIEDIKRGEIQHTFFVSKDKIFDSSECRKVLTDSGVSIQIINGLKELREALEQHLEKERQTNIENRRRLLINSIRPMQERMEEFVKENLQPCLQADIGVVIRRVLSVTILSFDDAYLPMFQEVDLDDVDSIKDKVKFQINATAHVEIEIERTFRDDEHSFLDQIAFEQSPLVSVPRQTEIKTVSGTYSVVFVAEVMPTNTDYKDPRLLSFYIDASASANPPLVAALA